MDEADAVAVWDPAFDRRHLFIYFHAAIQRLGRRMFLRQQALATAEVYLARFYTKARISETNPYLMIATCVYLACKTEESPQHIRTVVSEARSLWPDHISSDPAKLAECEFYLIEEMDAYLIVHHPYRSLLHLLKQFAVSSEELQTAWAVVNDVYMTELPLLYSPHILAVTAIYLSLCAKTPGTIVLTKALSSGTSDTDALTGDAHTEKFVKWLADSTVDLEGVIDATQQIITLYEVWETYNERACKDVINKLIDSVEG